MSVSQHRSGTRVLIVGPDGSGKSSVATELKRLAKRQGWQVTHTHFRPRIPDASAAPVLTPHGRSAHPKWIAHARLAIRYLEFLKGHAGVWRRRRGRLVIIERGWWDQMVDPVRYRLPREAFWLVRLLGRMLPRADVSLLCDGNPQQMAARKDEITEAETERQLLAWRDLNRRAAKRTASLDTTNAPLHQQGDILVRCCLSGGAVADWKSVPVVPSRLELRVTGRGIKAIRMLKVYQPLTLPGKVAKSLGALATLSGVGRPVPPPLHDWAAFGRLTGTSLHPAVSLTSNGQRAHVILAANSIFKVAAADDPDLQHEISILQSLPQRIGPCEAPTIRQVYTQLKGLLVLELAQFHGHATADTRADAIATQTAIGLAQLPRPITHGDFAPWNMLHSNHSSCLIDWQRSTDQFVPAWDLLTWHVQKATHLRRRPPDTLAREATAGNGWIREYCRALNIAPASLMPGLRRQLRTWTAVPSYSIGFGHDVLNRIESCLD